MPRARSLLPVSLLTLSACSPTVSKDAPVDSEMCVDSSCSIPGSPSAGNGQTANTTTGSNSGGASAVAGAGNTATTGGADQAAPGGASTSGGETSAAGADAAVGGMTAASGAAAAGSPPDDIPMGGGTAGSGDAGAGAQAGAAGTNELPEPLPWQGAIAAELTDTLLQSEYDSWKAAFTQACPDGSSVVVKDGGQVVSEGIAYGMLLSVAFDDRPLFDGLWQHYTDHVDENGLMNWSMGVCDAAGNNNANAATDAELDAAMALLQANSLWQEPAYLAAAEDLTQRIIQYETEMCDAKLVLRPGDFHGGCSDPENPRLNPSYFSPGYYRAFAYHFPDQAATWLQLIDNSYELFELYQARMDGLVPDWSAVDGSDWYGAGYSWDACRTPWRVAVDYAWSADPRAVTFLGNLVGWIESAGGGMPAGEDWQKNSAFQGAFALAAINDQARLDSYVSAWLSAGGDDSPYFQAILRVLYMLPAAGRFPSTL